VVGFDWDEGNVEKSWQGHGVRASECEEVFFNQPLLVHDDPRHSQDEPRMLALGKTHVGRRLFVVFTQRGGRIRVISARAMSRRERRSYGEAESQVDS
jgi:uncharacterized DUF497 family protein